MDVKFVGVIITVVLVVAKSQDLGKPKLCSLSIDEEIGTVNGDCYIPRTYSASGQYKCQWSMFIYNADQDLASAFVLVKFTESGQVYYHASCGFSTPVPAADGSYNLYITFTPGTERLYVGAVNVANENRRVTGNVFTGPKPLTLRGTTFASLEFTCNTPDLQPRPEHTWDGVKCDDENQLTDTCRFTPRFSEDEGRTITCTTNFMDDIFRPRSVKTVFKLNLDPPDPPLIIGYRPGQVVHAGSALSLLCTVSGGTPKVKSVTFYCGGHRDVDDIVTQTGVSSTVNIKPLGETDNGTVCRCRAVWEKDTTLNLTTSITLVVHTQGGSSPTGTTLQPNGSTQTEDDSGGENYSSSNTGDSPPLAAIVGGVIAAVVVIIIVVIVIVLIIRRRKEMEERVSAKYTPGDGPYEVNEAYQPVSRGPSAPADPSDEDHDLVSDGEGWYSSVNTGSPQGKGNGTQTRPELSLDHDLYTAVDGPSIPVSAPAASVQGDGYAVVNKPRKTKSKPQFQPGVYGQVNKPRPIPGGDVYAQVDKPAKRTVADTGDDNYAVVQKPKPGLKSKPTCTVKPNPRDTSGSPKRSGGDGEYNVLRFQGHNSDTPASTDTEQFYSHITSE